MAERIKGGIASYLDEVCAYQQAQLGDASVALVIPDAEVCYLERPGSVRLSTYQFQDRGPLAMLRLFWTVRREIATFRPDVVHLHSSFAGLCGRLAAVTSRPRPAVAYCAHGWSVAIETAHWKRRLYARVESALARITDVIINISAADNRDSVAAGVDPGKSVIVPNGILPMHPMDGEEVSRSAPGEPLRLLFVGRFDRQKGIDLLLDAMRALRRQDIRLTVIGSPVLGRTKVEVPRHVTVIDWLPRHALPGYYTRADAVVMPSRWEGFGMVAIEAMCCGTPVIASNRGALPEIVRDGHTGIVLDIDRESALLAVLESLDRGELRTMGEKARVEFQNRFTSEIMNQTLVRIYRWLIGEMTRDEALTGNDVTTPQMTDTGVGDPDIEAGSIGTDRSATGTTR